MDGSTHLQKPNKMVGIMSYAEELRTLQHLREVGFARKAVPIVWRVW